MEHKLEHQNIMETVRDLRRQLDAIIAASQEPQASSTAATGGAATAADRSGTKRVKKDIDPGELAATKRTVWSRRSDCPTSYRRSSDP